MAFFEFKREIPAQCDFAQSSGLLNGAVSVRSVSFQSGTSLGNLVTAEVELCCGHMSGVDMETIMNY